MRNIFAMDWGGCNFLQWTVISRNRTQSSLILLTKTFYFGMESDAAHVAGETEGMEGHMARRYSLNLQITKSFAVKAPHVPTILTHLVLCSSDFIGVEGY